MPRYRSQRTETLLSARGKAYEQIAIDAEGVLSVIEEFAGVPFDDKASPEVIQREFGLSKAAFSARGQPSR